MLYKTAMNDLQEPVKQNKKLECPPMEKGEFVDKSHYERQYGKAPKPTWLGVGVMTLVGMVVGLLLGVGI